MKVIILDKNVEYAERLKRFVEKHHPMLQLFVCDNIDSAKTTMNIEKCDVVLADAVFSEEPSDFVETFEKTAAFSFFSERNEIVNDREAFCKYITVKEMYDKICSLYERKKNRILKEKEEGESDINKTQVITFFSASGGAGSSTMAAACAMALSQSTKVLYMNFEQLSSEGAFFSGSGKKGISDVIALLKTRYTDADIYNQLKEIIVHDEKQGNENLFFIRGYRNAKDCPSMSSSGIDTIVSLLREQFDFDNIVIDVSFIAGPVFDKIVFNSDQIVLVSVGSDVSNEKMLRVRRYIEVVGRESKTKMPRMNAIFNQYYGMKDEEVVTKDMRVLLRLPRYRTNEAAHVSSQTIINTILATGNAFSEFR